MTSRKDLKLYETAVRNQWPITAEYKDVLVKSMMRIVADPASTAREKTAAARVLMIANAQNQTEELIDEAIIVDRTQRSGNRFLEIANRLGIVIDSQAVSITGAEDRADAVGIPINSDGENGEPAG